MKKVAVLNDLSGFGKCSLTAAIPVLSVLGLQCCPLPSAVLTNQTGYPFYESKDLSDMLPAYIDAWTKNEASFDGIYSGFMFSSEQIEAFMGFLDHFYKENTLLLVDPILGDNGHRFSIFSDAHLESMKKLSRRADIITPNLTEACLLADMDLKKAFSQQNKSSLFAVAEEAGRIIRDLSEKDQDVVITGIKCKDEDLPCIYNLSISSEGIHETCSPFFDQSFSGTGDLFASVICGCRLKGLSTAAAMDLANNFLYHSIADTIKDGTNGREGVNFENFLNLLY